MVYKSLWLLASIGLIIASYKNLSEQTKHCGEIIKITQEQSVSGGRRSSGYTERYVLIRFSDIGIKAINLDPTSYYTARLGQKACVNLSKSELGTQSTWAFACFIIGCISGFISIPVLISHFVKF